MQFNQAEPTVCKRRLIGQYPQSRYRFQHLLKYHVQSCGQPSYQGGQATPHPSAFSTAQKLIEEQNMTPGLSTRAASARQYCGRDTTAIIRCSTT